jgi:lantibiotic modifying enzyme
MATCIDSPIDRLIEKMIEKNEDGDFDWTWHGKRYLGAAHGEIGIITQLVLSKPSLAGHFANRMKKLLDLQKGGNWPSSELDGETGRKDLVQWCHGAPGFIYSLEALRPHFPAMRPSHPDMRVRIDAVLADAKELVWEKGLLTKEPSLCHGILGNAL